MSSAVHAAVAAVAVASLAIVFFWPAPELAPEPVQPGAQATNAPTRIEAAPKLQEAFPREVKEVTVAPPIPRREKRPTMPASQGPAIEIHAAAREARQPAEPVVGNATEAPDDSN